MEYLATILLESKVLKGSVGRAVLVLKVDDIICRVSTTRKSDLFLVHFNINNEDDN